MNHGKQICLALAVIASGTMGLAASGSAQDYGYHHRSAYDYDHYNEHTYHGPYRPGRPAPARIVFADRDRQLINNYYVTTYRHGCPAGTYYSHRRCLVPAAPRYVIGQPIAPGVTIMEVPAPLQAELAPPPPGYYYGQVDNDVVLLSPTHNVVDAVSLNAVIR